MNLETLAVEFCLAVNKILPDNPAETVVDALLAKYPDQAKALATLNTAFKVAFEPTTYVTTRIEQPNAQFEQIYELLGQIFGKSELEPHDQYAEMLKAAAESTQNSPLVLIGRFWSSAGLCRYDKHGHLLKFDYDSLNFRRSTHIRSLINSNYMRLPPDRFQQSGIGAIGHTAPYPPTDVVNLPALQMFEDHMRRIAQSRSERLRLFIVEADSDCIEFFYNAGYRWPTNSVYEQPPMEFDEETGNPLNPPIPQTLMVKHGDPGASSQSVDLELLKVTVQRMIEEWCLFDVERSTAYPEKAKERARAEVRRVRLAFEASLPKNTTEVPLGEPEM